MIMCDAISRISVLFWKLFSLCTVQFLQFHLTHPISRLLLEDLTSVCFESPARGINAKHHRDALAPLPAPFRHWSHDI